MLEVRNLLSTFTVDHLADDLVGDGLNGSLRYCIMNASDGDDITFGEGVTGTINLTRALPDLTGSISIEGPGADLLTVRRGDPFGVYRIFTVGASATVRLAGLTIADGLGSIVGGGILNRGALAIDRCTVRDNDVLADLGSGCGIYNAGTLTVTRSTIRDNVGSAIGGGIANDGTLTVADSTLSGNRGSDGGGIANDGTLTVISSILSGNSAGSGGGIDSGGPRTLTLTNSTVSGNSAHDFGGGIRGGDTLTITNSTLSGNSARSGGGIAYSGTGFDTLWTITNSTLSGNAGSVEGGGIDGQGTELHARNTILAGNTSPVGPDMVGSLASSGYNLIGNPQGGSGFDPTDLLNVDPLLGPLQDNGGPTQTMALQAGSPALNAGDPNQLGTADQRGVIRTGGVNIGAYQASATAFLLSAPDTITAGVPFDVTVTAVDPFRQVAVGYTGTVTFSTTDADPGVVLPADYSFTLDDGGVHTFSDTGLGETTLITPGDQTLTVMDTADNTITGGAIITVNSGPGPALHGHGPPPSTLQPSPAQGGAWTRSEPSASAVVAADQWFASFQPNDQGSATFMVTLDTQGPVHLTVTDTADNTVFAALDLIVL
jgi:hypothetical protein